MYIYDVFPSSWFPLVLSKVYNSSPSSLYSSSKELKHGGSAESYSIMLFLSSA